MDHGRLGSHADPWVPETLCTTRRPPEGIELPSAAHLRATEITQFVLSSFRVRQRVVSVQFEPRIDVLVRPRVG